MHPEHTGQPPVPANYPQAPAGYYPPPGYWQQPKPPASGLRVAAGVVALVSSVVGIMIAGIYLFVRHGGASTPFNGWMNFFLIVGSVGCLVTGIVILAKQRRKGGATPRLVTSFSGLMVLGCLGFLVGGNSGLPGAPLMVLPFALATLVLGILVVVKDKPQGRVQHR
ncbi:hypothetical protein [Pseudarthrobacter sp. BRE9]|uniref:hypothetical protein n=1 Tax=Pseudarthrobacter sp. BRE9 TaxID=2962582 RepID=UPI00288145AC|nr:hypothetical protein [Pseudarthrobacter sp. BRE9]MDT0168887.1 hypothetical protein [Pseudarthrobacter sp. BRE9]